MRHRVRRSWRAWESIGASGKVLDMIRHGVKIPFRGGRRPRPFNHGVSLRNATPAQLSFMDSELERFMACGAWEEGHSDEWVSRLFLVPKPGVNKWRLIIDLRELNAYCETWSLKFETLKRLRHLARHNDWMLSFDLQDGYYALGIDPEYRDFFTVNYRGKLYRLAGLPMGWNLSPAVFVQFTQPLIRYLRSSAYAPPPPCAGKRARHYLRNGRHKGVRMLPFMDDFLLLAGSYEEAIQLRSRVDVLLDSLGLIRHPTKGYWEPVQVGEHLGLEIDTRQGLFRAPVSKLARISSLAKDILCRASRDHRWVPARLLRSLAGQAQFLYLAIAPARFFLRELHDVLSRAEEELGPAFRRVQLTKQLSRDLRWWVTVPQEKNGRSIFKLVETAFLHTDSSSFAWGGVLNHDPLLQARGFWTGEDTERHITFKELKAVRLCIESFLPHCCGRTVLLHEDNQSVVSVLTHLTSRSPAMMTELRKLWWLLDHHDIQLRVRYIRSAANVWADRLSRELASSDDFMLHPQEFRSLQHILRACTVDRFASSEDRLLDRYYSRFRDPGSRGLDALSQPDEDWQSEVNWCHPPPSLLNSLVQKSRQSGARATVLAPLWEGRSWLLQLSDMASRVVVLPPRRGLFLQLRRGARVPAEPLPWSVGAFEIPGSLPGSI